MSHFKKKIKKKKSDTFSNSSENQIAHSKLLKFQTFSLLKREEMSYYPARDETRGNAFSYRYPSLLCL